MTPYVLLFLVFFVNCVYGEKKSIPNNCTGYECEISVFCHQGKPYSELSYALGHRTVLVSSGASFRVASSDEWSYLSATSQDYPSGYLLRRSQDTGPLGDLLMSMGARWWWSSETQVSPYGETCVNIWRASRTPQSIQITQTEVAGERVATMVVGVLLVLMAPRLSKTLGFYYTTGAILGVLAAVLTLVIVVGAYNKELNKYHMAVATVAQGILSMMYSQIIELLKEYTELVGVPMLVFMLLGVLATRWSLLSTVDASGPTITPRLSSTVEIILEIVGVFVCSQAFASRTYGCYVLVCFSAAVVMRHTKTPEEEATYEPEPTTRHVANRVSLARYFETDKTEEEVNKLLQSEEFKIWLRRNHTRVTVT